jgi:hypothetical protein
VGGGICIGLSGFRAHESLGELLREITDMRPIRDNAAQMLNTVIVGTLDDSELSTRHLTLNLNLTHLATVTVRQAVFQEKLANLAQQGRQQESPLCHT